MNTTGGVGRWTRFFTVGSALSMVALQATLLLEASLRTIAVVGLFGAVLPMVFGMAYLLVPSYVGRTLSTPWLPGVHFVLAYVGATVLVTNRFVGLDPAVVALGGVLWSLGVIIFVGTLLWTVVPAIVADREFVFRSPNQPQRSTRLATVVIPVAIGYLVVGTVALLSALTPLPDIVGATIPVVVHYYGAGFVTLLIFAFGARLLTGFFHVTLPRFTTGLVLVCGAVGPAMLAPNLWRPPWFLVGAGLEAVAMVGYLGIVGVLAVRTDRRRVGLYGIGLGAVSGAAAVTVAVSVAVGIAPVRLIVVHAPVVLDGFLLATIIGYAYQFFPVTSRQFVGATERATRSTIVLLGLGVALQVAGSAVEDSFVRRAGVVVALLGTAGYAYLISRRLIG